MTKQEALEIIKKEGLHGYNGGSIKANEVGIQFKNNFWIVYSTDEKHPIILLKNIKMRKMQLSM